MELVFFMGRFVPTTPVFNRSRDVFIFSSQNIFFKKIRVCGEHRVGLDHFLQT